MLRNAQHDFGIVVSGSIRTLLARQRNGNSGIIATRLRQNVGRFPSGHFDARPFPPKIDSGGGFNHVRNISAAHAGRYLDKINFPVFVRAQEFSMRHAAHESQRFNQFAIDLLQRPEFR